MRSANFLISTFFGIGKLPGAPGTWASIAAAPLFWLLMDQPLWLFGLVLVVIYFVGVYCTSQYEKQIGEKDPSSAVIDEVLGVGVAMMSIPHQWPYAVVSSRTLPVPRQAGLKVDARPEKERCGSSAVVQLGTAFAETRNQSQKPVP